MYILILIFHVADDGANAHHVEFSNKDSCIKARNLLIDQSKSHNYAGYLRFADCVPKG